MAITTLKSWGQCKGKTFKRRVCPFCALSWKVLLKSASELSACWPF